MSGGIDSFVTALLLRDKGYEVTGVTLELWGKNDTEEVEKYCRKLQIPLITGNGHELFCREVVQPFIDGYLTGLTPSPCCICNRYVKWKLLQSVADELQIGRIATGHYVRIVCIGGKYYIRKGVDPHKDQSYFLWGIPQDILSRALTPLGDFTKAEVKAWALANGYEQMVRKKESMGVCFLGGHDYRDFITRNTTCNTLSSPGSIVDRTGNEIGRHSGLLNYTVGQKKGMPENWGRSLYVAEIDPGRNRIVADVKNGLYTGEFVVEQLHSPDIQELLTAPDVEVRVRGLGLNPDGYVRMERIRENCARIFLSAPAWAVAPGQPVAFYRGDVLIGGGIAGRDSRYSSPE